MGAALSCIALPAIGSVGTWIASCFSAAACSLFCKRYVNVVLLLDNNAYSFLGIRSITAATATTPLQHASVMRYVTTLDSQQRYSLTMLCLV